jgi:hypothetical protein
MPLQIFEQRYLELVKTPCAAARASASCTSSAVRRSVTVGAAGPRAMGAWPHRRLGSARQRPPRHHGAGRQRFRPATLWREDSGLVRAEVELLPELGARADDRGLGADAHGAARGWRPPARAAHRPDIDFDDAWQVAFSLVQLLPLDEGSRSRLLLDSVDGAAHARAGPVLNDISGEDAKTPRRPSQSRAGAAAASRPAPASD